MGIEEAVEHGGHLVKEGVIRRGGRSCVDEDNHVVGSHLFGDHECVFPVLHLTIRRAKVFAFATTESLEGFLCILVGKEDDLGAELAAQTTYESEAGDEVALFLGIAGHRDEETGDGVEH